GPGGPGFQTGPQFAPQPLQPRKGAGAAGPLLVAAAVMMGLLAGLFFTFDLSIMPGLKRLDDVQYLTAMQNFNDLIDNSGPFGMVFVAAFVVIVWAAVIEYRRGRKKVALWAGIAGGLYLVALLITFSVNIPLNMELADLGDPAKAKDLSIVDKFKGIWSATNIVRTILCTAAVGCVAHALKLHGRATADTAPAPRH
ncbi:DUF1772 domain-containing protein, partial [Streptomyces sp. T-3]|nr:DUF1772 domain-containing protein [Streptomyces sp. T-3]